MLKDVLELYHAARTNQVCSLIPHLIGPPGSGKSTVAYTLVDLLNTGTAESDRGVRLHVLNVSRISPLELEGVQMPVKNKLEMLLSTFWNDLQEGDVVLLDEFLRGFPEVYNGLLDIITSRQVAGHKLPWVFFLAASNSAAAYDVALEDRLLDLKVPDPRKSFKEDKKIRSLMQQGMGLRPEAVDSHWMISLMRQRVDPMYSSLDMKKGVLAGTATGGMSPRKLIGQVQLRRVECSELHDLLKENNREAMSEGEPQYVVVYSFNGDLAFEEDQEEYTEKARALIRDGKLEGQQLKQAQLNLQLLAANNNMKETS